MNELKNSGIFFKLLSGCAALVPGLLILQKELPIPPSFSPALMACLVEIFSCFVLIFLWINKKKIIRYSFRKFNKATIFSIVLFLIAFVTYIVLFNFSIINSPEWGKPIFIPVFSGTAEIKEGGFQQYYDKYGVDEINYLLETSYKTSLTFHKVLIYLVFILNFVMLTVTFSLLWLKYEALIEKTRKP